MDEMTEQFRNLGREEAENDSSHRNLYKNGRDYGNQDERRAESLMQQRSNSDNLMDTYRCLYDLVEDTDESNTFRNNSRVQHQPRIRMPGFTYKIYDNILMQSEWMMQKPIDLEANWSVAPCPKGVRVLVVSCGGQTRLYTKHGQLLDTFLSRLPGGYQWLNFKESSILDGFYCKEIYTIFVLDLLSWKSNVMAGGEMAFRRYWLEAKFYEHPSYEKTSRRYMIRFKLLPMVGCDRDSLQHFMMTYPLLEGVKLDGLLFYHRQASYVTGVTPLVGWLYPYMVPEVLYPGMTIHPAYEAAKPKGYVDQATFVKKFDEKWRKKQENLKIRRMRREQNAVAMEAENDAPEERFVPRSDNAENEDPQATARALPEDPLRGAVMYDQWAIDRQISEFYVHMPLDGWYPDSDEEIEESVKEFFSHFECNK